MRRYEFDIDFPSEDDDEAYDGPDAYPEGDDNVLELEVSRGDVSFPADEAGSNSITQILRCMCLVVCLSARTPTSHLSALFDLQQSGGTTERTTNSGTNNTEGRITYGDLVRLLQTGPPRGDQDEDDEDMDNGDGEYPSDSDRDGQRYPPHTEPQKGGAELLMSGEFGRVRDKIRTRKGSKNISRLLLDRSCMSQGMPSREELINVSSI